jgi:hypothetical protein
LRKGSGLLPWQGLLLRLDSLSGQEDEAVVAEWLLTLD